VLIGPQHRIPSLHIYQHPSYSSILLSDAA
jgi:hypothetical protein